MPANKEKKPLIDVRDAASIMRGAENDEMVQISLKIPKSLLDRCDKGAKYNAITRSAFIKIALVEALTDREL
jgi:hypothetical protein